MKSTSYEIIDPSMHVMVNKASNEASLLNENINLKQLNSIIIISAIVIVVGTIFYTVNQKRDIKDDN